MPGLATDIIGVFLGAALGAYLGYLATRRHGAQEIRARRNALFRVLSNQLNIIPADGDRPFDETEILTRSTVNVSAAGILLAGNVLDAEKDATLIRRLIVWQGFEASFNEQVRIINQGLVTMTIPQGHRAAWHDQLNTLLEFLRLYRASVLEALPQEFRSPSWPQDQESVSVKDEGILIRRHVETHRAGQTAGQTSDRSRGLPKVP